MRRSLALLLGVVAGTSCARGMTQMGADGARSGDLAAGLEARAMERASDRPSLAHEAAAAHFGEPLLVGEISNAADAVSDSDPSLSADQLELYFTSQGRPGGVLYEDLWRSEREVVTEPWGKPVLVPLSTASRDAQPAISPDGLTLAFATNRAGGSGGWDVWISTRPASGALWASPTPASGINSDLDELPASISNDRLLLLFSRSSDNTDLYVGSRKAASDTWTIVKIAGLNTTSFDSHPALSADQRSLAFDSDRPGGKGLRDLYLATRPSVPGDFQAATPILELNTATNDADPWISSDLRTIYFARSPVGATGIFASPCKLYQAKR